MSRLVIALFGLYALMSVCATAQEASQTPKHNSVNATEHMQVSDSLVVHSGATTNAKAVSWDDPVAVDGTVVRVRDLWLLATAPSSGSLPEQHLRNPERRSPEAVPQVHQQQKANQRCGAGSAGAYAPECSQAESENPKSQTTPPQN